MQSYLFIETRDPFEARDAAWVADMAGRIGRTKAPVAVLLTQNAVMAARRGSAATEFAKLAKAGVAVMADRFAQRERGIPEIDMAADVIPADLDVVVDHLMNGAKVIWR